MMPGAPSLWLGMAVLALQQGRLDLVPLLLRLAALVVLAGVAGSLGLEVRLLV